LKREGRRSKKRKNGLRGQKARVQSQFLFQGEDTITRGCWGGYGPIWESQGNAATLRTAGNSIRPSVHRGFRDTLSSIVKTTESERRKSAMQLRLGGEEEKRGQYNTRNFPPELTGREDFKKKPRDHEKNKGVRLCSSKKKEMRKTHGVEGEKHHPVEENF